LTAFYLKTDVRIERVNQVLQAYLRQYIDYNQSNWPTLFLVTKFAYNNLPHASIGTLLFFANKKFHLTLGIQILSPTDKCLGALFAQIKYLHNYVKVWISIAQAAYMRVAGAKRRAAPRYKVKDKVFLSIGSLKTTQPTNKLANKLTGPYKTVKILNLKAVKIKLLIASGTPYPTFKVS
jgi:hypothetical protein